MSDVIEATGEIRFVAVGEVAAVCEVHGENFITRFEYGEIDGGVGLRAGVWLDVGVVGAEKLFGALDGEGFDDIYVFASAIPTFARVALGVFVGEQRALCFHDGGGCEVFRGDQLDVVPLAMLLADDGFVEFRV